MAEQCSELALEPQLRTFSRIGVKKTTGYKLIKRGLLPKPIPILGSDRTKGIPAHETSAIIRARIAGKTDDEIRLLVAELEAFRTEIGRGENENVIK